MRMSARGPSARAGGRFAFCREGEQGASQNVGVMYPPPHVIVIESERGYQGFEIFAAG